MNYPDVLLPKEAANLLGINVHALRQRVYEGRIKHIRLFPGGLRFLKKDIEKLIEGVS